MQFFLTHYSVLIQVDEDSGMDLIIKLLENSDILTCDQQDTTLNLGGLTKSKMY